MNNAFNGPRDAFDALSRTDYKDDVDFLEAVAAENVRRNTPEFRKAYEAAARRLAAEKEEAKRLESQEKYDAIRASITISSDVSKRLRAEAINRANSDMRLGKITAGQFDKAVEKYVKDATENYKDTEAANRHINAMLRGQL